MVSPEVLLNVLPPYKGETVVVKKRQEVSDIMREVVRSHSIYAADYDLIAKFFIGQSVYQICNALFDFCKINLRYKIESENLQTTKSPAAILTLKNVDCKHYAGWIGGVLDAINRTGEMQIPWFYRFASYNWIDDTPQHVFIVVEDGNQTLWVDPVLSKFNDRLQPAFYIDQKPRSMSLQRLSGLENQPHNQNIIGWTVESSTGYTSSGPTIVPKVGHPFYGDDFLGLSRYGNPTNTNVDTLVLQLQSYINGGPAPYQLNRTLVDKILRDNVQNWNFFFPNGTSPIPRPWRTLPALNDLQIIITDDGRLTLSKDEEPPHNHPNIHHWVDWANFYVQALSPTPYIVILDHIKRLGKGWKTPEKGSLWEVISGDDRLAASVKEKIMSIPGLKEAIEGAGFDPEQIEKSLFPLSSGNLALDDVTPTENGGIIPPPGTNKSSVLPLALLAGGVIFMMRKKKRVSGPGNYLVPVIAAILIYKVATKGNNSGLNQPAQ